VTLLLLFETQIGITTDEGKIGSKGGILKYEATVFFTLSFVILMGCGGKTVEVTVPQEPPANPNAPQAACLPSSKSACGLV
jgi:hypothetical protein